MQWLVAARPIADMKAPSLSQWACLSNSGHFHKTEVETYVRGCLGQSLPVVLLRQRRLLWKRPIGLLRKDAQT